MISLRKAQIDIYDLATRNGFWGPTVTIGDKIALIHSEVSEALEVHRDPDHTLGETWYRESDGKPEGFAIELADAVIRILDLAEHVGVDIEGAMEEKMAFNQGRPFMHGKTL